MIFICLIRAKLSYSHFISTAEVLLLDNEVAVFRSGTECKFYIAGPVEEVI